MLETKTLVLSLFLLALAARPARADEVRTLSLAEALRMLESQSFVLAEAKSRVEQARALVGQATSPLLPQVAAAGGYVRNSDEAKVGFRETFGPIFSGIGQPMPEGMPGTLYIQPIGVWTVSASAKVPLVVPSAWAERKAAERASEAAAASLGAVRLGLRAALAQAAWAAAAAEDVVAASERAVVLAEEHRRTSARMHEAGETAALSVLKAETEVVRRQSDLLRARADLSRARLAIGVLLGKSLPLRVLPDPVPDTAAPSEILVREALEQRPEVAASLAKIRAADAWTLSARLRLLPQLSGSAAAFASDMPYPTGEKQGWRLTVDLMWPLFDGGYRGSKRAESAAEGQGARAAAEAQRLSIAQEVADAARDVQVAKERLRLAEQQAKFAAEAAASANRTFAAGVTGSLEVLDANDRLYLADVALAEARGRLGVASAALSKAVGRDF
ncbi:MAG: TolC family protein [Deltaproteobacteria bacterium]|nr:TolC family protein [Deltaproteobacteria bacterium]